MAVPLIALLMPPLQAADEPAHAQRANEISHGGLVATRYGGRMTSGGAIDSVMDRLWPIFEGLRFRSDGKLTDAMMRRAAGVARGPVALRSFPNTAIYPPMLYAPAVVGDLTARVLHLSVLDGLLISRLLDGATSTILAAAAIGLGGSLAPLLFTLLCLPMSLALFAAVTQDGPMIALSALAASLFMRTGRSGRALAIGSVALALVAMARPSMLPFCLLPWLLPGVPRRSRMVSTVLPIALVLGWTALTDRITLYGPAADQVGAQIQALRLHPELVATLAWTTLRDQWIHGCDICQGFVGVLGWLDTPLPPLYDLLTAIVLTIALAISMPSRPLLDDGLKRFAAGLLFLSAVGAVFLLEYLSWSRIGGPVVTGVQGRYFLPIMPFLGFLLPRRRIGEGIWIRMALCLYPTLSLTITIRTIVLRYYLS